MTGTDTVRHADSRLLAAAAAARLITTVVDAQLAHGAASVVLTGGGTGIEMLRQVRASPARDAVDWAAVDFYWGDERFVPAGDPERNETQAREALLDHLPLDPRRVHPMAPSDGAFGSDADAAARAYAELLPPRFDVCLLGVGEEGHVASMFPGSPAVRESRLAVVAVYDSPKPPPTRISLTLPAIRRAAQVWLMTAGSGKADAVATALGGTSEVDLPAYGARGQQRTLWLVDHAAAGGIVSP
ncbi:MAG: 6-phosphogluconolactonase [Pseudonocardiaceae bacterium]|nr:6-phosphogluconolactonase [Pseudonocardiaceae bacterium]